MISAAVSERSLWVRRASPEDQNFVTSTLAQQLIRNGETVRDANAVVDRIVDSDSVRIVVAADADQPVGKDIIGWLVYAAIPRVRAVLFVYVRRGNRGQGIAQTLVNAAWPKRTGQFVHAGLVGGSTRQLLDRFSVVEMPLEDFL